MGIGAAFGGGNEGAYITLVNKMDVCKSSEVPNEKKRVVVGRVIATTQPLQSPLSFRKCVLYKIKVEVADQFGNWSQLFIEKQGQDFFLSDGLGSPVFIQTSVFEEDFVGKVGVNRTQPLAPQQYGMHRDLFNRHGYDIQSFPGVRFLEDIYEIGEQIAVLGKSQIITCNGVQILALEPANCTQYDQRWYQKHNFSEGEMRMWESFIGAGKFICSDDPNFMKGILVPPLPMAWPCNSRI